VRPFSARELHAVIELALLKNDAENAEREIEDRFFEDSIDLLCHLDFNGHFKRLNPAWECTLGFTREELMSRPFIDFVHPDDRERTLKQSAAVRGGERALGFENRYEHYIAMHTPTMFSHGICPSCTKAQEERDERLEREREL